MEKILAVPSLADIGVLFGNKWIKYVSIICVAKQIKDFYGADLMLGIFVKTHYCLLASSNYSVTKQDLYQLDILLTTLL